MIVMCTINLKKASQKIMLATAVKHEIKNWEGQKKFLEEIEYAFAPQTAKLIDKNIADYKELLALLEDK